MPQYSVDVNNAQLDQVEAVIGTSAVGEMRTGPPPVNCAAADTGVLLAIFNLPPDWMGAASGASKALMGTWSDASANATGDAGHFRIWNNARTICGLQVKVSITGGDGEMQRNDIGIIAGTPVDIETFTLVAGNQ